MIRYELKLSQDQLSRLLVLVDDESKDVFYLNTNPQASNDVEVELMKLSNLKDALSNARTICATCGQGVQHD